ncbi:cytochrome P450 family protein [Nonomuraea soli]|uniref:Cytochrome P450 n=1 Tax=Nonomuraea soli TaxID=1032476 RepID=A0A7W0HS87_9ACTN|nr:cytochrome P450 [Nonomuraea soli]MBA2893755.1 cytochrome P450 [Nonomuraea soli]
MDLESQLFQPDPYPAYARLRDQAPAVRVDGAGGDIWVITRYEEARAALTDPRLAKDPTLAPRWMQEIGLFDGDEGPAGRTMLVSDPPDHTRLRKLVARAFTHRRIENLRPRVQRIADDLLDTLPRETDLVAAFAFPLPITVICELLGVPLDDRADFQRWTRELLTPPYTPPGAETRRRGAAAMEHYITALIERLRERLDPGLAADEQPDLLSALINGGGLNERELLGMAQLLLVAGHETTVNLIANAVFALLRHPGQYALLRERPELIPSAVEELLRYDGPVERATPRFALEDVTIGDTTIPKGSAVQVGLGSAARDPRRFPDADRLDITRSDNPHLAFGHGIHHCLGAPLARLEAQVALATLLRRFPSITLACAPEDLSWRAGGPSIIRGLEALPIRT